MKPRIVFFTPGLSIGGAERWVVSLCKHLKACEVAGIRVTGQWYHASVVAEVRRAGIPLLVPTEEVHCHAVVTWGIPNIRDHVGQTTLPIIEVSHSTVRFPDQRELLARSAHQATHLVAVSKRAISGFPEEYRSRATVIENGVEQDRLVQTTDLRAQWGLKDGDKVALFLGRFALEKGPDLFIEAVRHLPPEWTAVMVGQGELEGVLEAAAGRCGHRVIFGKPVSQVGDVYAAADVVCLPSQVEGHPLVMLESWLVGKPVVTTPFLTAQEVVAEHGPVLDISTWDPQQLAASMTHPSCDVDLARKLALDRYTAEAMGQRWDEYLTGIMEGGSWTT